MIELLIVWLIIGAIAGWLAGQIVKGYGLGLVGNIVVGIIGAIMPAGCWPWWLYLVGGILAAIVNAVIGAVILLIIVGFFKK